MAQRVSTRLTPAQGRHFGLVVGGAMLVFGTLSWWRGHQIPPVVLWSLGTLLIAGGLAIPARLGPVHHLWMQLAEAMSRVTTPILMSLVYFLIVMPTGVLMRWFGRNSLVRPAASKSYWIERLATKERSTRMHRQF